MTLTPDEDQFFVLVWREQNSTRLRTYVSPGTDNVPLAVPLSDIFPTAAQTISTADDFKFWLATPIDDETVAVTEEVVRAELGWSPQRASTEESPPAL